MVPGLIHKCYLAKRDATPLVIWGSGKPLRQFISSHDVAKLMVWVLGHYDSVEPLILSVDEEDEVSIGDVAREIADAMDFNGRSSSMRAKRTDSSRRRLATPNYVACCRIFSLRRLNKD